MGRKTKNYTEDFKKQIVELRKKGKTLIEITKEYGIAKSTINKWVSDYNNIVARLKQKITVAKKQTS